MTPIVSRIVATGRRMKSAEKPFTALRREIRLAAPSPNRPPIRSKKR